MEIWRISLLTISFLISGLVGLGQHAHDKEKNRAYKSIGNDKE